MKIFLTIFSSIISLTLCSHGALIGYWDFEGDLDESSGFQADGVHDGVAVGMISYSTGPTGFGQALDLTNGTSAVRVLNTSLTATDGNYQNTYDNDINSGPFTIAMWVRGLPDGSWEPYISKKGEQNHGYQIRRRQNGQNLTFTARGTAGADDPNGGSTTWNTGNWHHVTGVFDGAGNRLLYIDGVLDSSSITDGSDTGSIGSPTNEFLVFGGRDNGDNTVTNFSGVELDEIRIYDEALTQAQISALIIPEPVGVVKFSFLIFLILLMRQRRSLRPSLV